MCMDPLSRVQVLVAAAINDLVADYERHPVDPAVLKAVLSRLRKAQRLLKRAQAGHSREKAWQLTREVIAKVVVELAINALRTTIYKLADLRSEDIHHARRHTKEAPPRLRRIAGGPRESGWHLSLFSFAC